MIREPAKRKSAVTCRFAALGQIADTPVIENGDGNGKDTRGSHQDGLYHEDEGYSLSRRRCFTRFYRTIGIVVYHESLLLATLSWSVFLDGGTNWVNSMMDSS